MSEVLQAVRQFLGVQPLRTSIYHPQTNGLVEQFNGTLKHMLIKFVSDSGKDWPQWVPFLLFAIRELPQASTRFSPFELLYREQPRSILDVLKEKWGMPPHVEEAPTSYLEALQKKLRTSAQLAQEELQKAQQDQQWRYDNHVKSRFFTIRQKVLLLLPSSCSKLLVRWQGLYKVVERMGETNYHVQVPVQGS